jgi:hypothetical protein
MLNPFVDVIDDMLKRASKPLAITNKNSGVAIPFQYMSMLTEVHGILVLTVLFPTDE